MVHRGARAMGGTIRGIVRLAGTVEGMRADMEVEDTKQVRGMVVADTPLAILLVDTRKSKDTGEEAMHRNTTEVTSGEQEKASCNSGQLGVYACRGVLSREDSHETHHHPICQRLISSI